MEVISGAEHTPNYHYIVESTTVNQIFVPKLKVSIADKKALDEMSTQLTIAHILLEQPSNHNTPIFLVAKQEGQVQDKEWGQRLLPYLS